MADWGDGVSASCTVGPIELSITKTGHVHFFLQVHVLIFLHTGIEYIHEKTASIEKCKKSGHGPF